MPTGVALRDPRAQLFAAAERVLVRAGVAGLTSRSVTAEAGCAKGVLHRHFTDFDDFLAELIYDRIARLQQAVGDLTDRAGSATVIDNVAALLGELFGSIGVSIVALMIARDDLRRRLRRTHPTGFPLLNEAGTILVGYLERERALGRIAAGADLGVLAPTLIGAEHLLYAGHDGGPPGPDEVRRVVASVLDPVLTR